MYNIRFIHKLILRTLFITIFFSTLHALIPFSFYLLFVLAPYLNIFGVDINASILSDQIKEYPKIARKKKIIFKKYKKKLSKIPQVFFPKEVTNKNRDFYLFPIGVNKKFRNRLIEHLLQKKIFVTVNFNSITRLNYYKKKYKKTNCHISEQWGTEQLSLPFHAKLRDSEINTVCLEIKRFFDKY